MNVGTMDSIEVATRGGADPSRCDMTRAARAKCTSIRRDGADDSVTVRGTTATTSSRWRSRTGESSSTARARSVIGNYEAGDTLRIEGVAATTSSTRRRWRHGIRSCWTAATAKTPSGDVEHQLDGELSAVTGRRGVLDQAVTGFSRGVGHPERTWRQFEQHDHGGSQRGRHRARQRRRGAGEGRHARLQHVADQLFGLGDNDTITIDEDSGAMPLAVIQGGEGDYNSTGASGDQLLASRATMSLTAATESTHLRWRGRRHDHGGDGNDSCSANPGTIVVSNVGDDSD